MRVRISDPGFTADLLRFFAQSDYLAVRDGRDVVDIVPMNPVSERYDRARLVRYLRQWEEEQPEGIRADIVQ